MKRILSLALLAAVIPVAIADNPFELASHRVPSIKTGGDCLIKGARILTVTKGVIERGDILVRDGKIAQVGPNLTAPAGVTVIDATGKVIMPGIVDAHIHRGIDATNEGSESITGECRIEDVLNPSARNVWQALAGGETAGLALHGSANSVGGQSAVIKLKFGRGVNDMRVQDAPRMIKFALGENVTRSGSTDSTRFPKTRMGVQALHRRAFTEAKQYIEEWAAYEKAKAAANGNGHTLVPPRKDLRLETLADILKGDIWVHCHSYRADEMLMMVRLSQEFGFKLAALQHALEAYKIAPEIAEAGVGVSMFVDNWSFKVEGYDAIPYNAYLCQRAGALVSINTDGTGGVPAINIDAAKVMRYGGLSEQQALAMITINPAKQLGIDHRVGSIEVGKDADLAIWDGHPLSVYARCNMTLIEGELYFQRRDAFGIDGMSTFKTVLDAISYKVPPAVKPDAKAYAITGATVHTVSGPVLGNATVVIRDGKIADVGPNVSVPSDALRIDGRGLNVYPGFIDAGTSIGLSEISPIGQMNDNRELGNYQPDLIASTAIQVESAHIPVARCNGITTTVTRPNGGVISGQASLVNLDGWTPELMSITSPYALCVSFGGGGFGGFGDEENSCGCDDLDHNGLDHTFDDLLGGSQGRRGQGGGGGGGNRTEELKKYFQDAKKYDEERRVGTAEIDVPLEAMRPYVRGERPVILRVRDARSIRDAVAFAKELGLKVILEGAQDSWKEAELLAKEGIPVIITPAGRSTLGANSPINEYDPYDTPNATPALLQKAGVKWCFMSDQNAGSENLLMRAAQSVPYGLKREDLIRAMTLSAAEILGVGDQLGSIEKGKVANIVVSAGDPCEPTGFIQYVFIEGKPIELESKHTMLRDKYLGRLK